MTGSYSCKNCSNGCHGSLGNGIGDDSVSSVTPIVHEVLVIGRNESRNNQNNGSTGVKTYNDPSSTTYDVDVDEDKVSVSILLSLLLLEMRND